MTDSATVLLPARLDALIGAGRWPTRDTVNSQNLRPLVKPERVQLFAPGETFIFFCSSPFHTVADEATGKMLTLFWSKYGALEMISPKDAIIIGDFGLGSDAPIILDCREGTSDPPVLYLRWARDGSRTTAWTKGADSFTEFADLLEL
jgi:hypothetical protein